MLEACKILVKKYEIKKRTFFFKGRTFWFLILFDSLNNNNKKIRVRKGIFFLSLPTGRRPNWTPPVLYMTENSYRIGEKNLKKEIQSFLHFPLFFFLCNVSSMSLYAFIKVSVMILSIDFHARSTLWWFVLCIGGQCTGYEDQFEPFPMLCLLHRKKPPFFFFFPEWWIFRKRKISLSNPKRNGEFRWKHFVLALDTSVGIKIYYPLLLMPVSEKSYEKTEYH